MIERYWNEMFGEFKTGERSFLIPGFPEPLMSPHFGVKNIIGEGNKEKGMTYKLCIFHNKGFTSPSAVKVESLERAISDLKFWRYQHKHNKESSAFMHRLLPFLVREEKVHFHLYLEEKGEIIASLIAGVAPKAVFLFNLSVREDFRQKGVAAEMLKGAQSLLGGSSFYWTKHPWLTLGAPQILSYHVVH